MYWLMFMCIILSDWLSPSTLLINTKLFAHITPILCCYTLTFIVCCFHCFFIPSVTNWKFNTSCVRLRISWLQRWPICFMRISQFTKFLVFLNRILPLVLLHRLYKDSHCDKKIVIPTIGSTGSKRRTAKRINIASLAPNTQSVTLDHVVLRSTPLFPSPPSLNPFHTPPPSPPSLKPPTPRAAMGNSPLPDRMSIYIYGPGTYMFLLPDVSRLSFTLCSLS